MLVFVDESGDTGLKIDRGSSRLFVVVLVILADENDVQTVEELIESLKSKFSLSRGEFHFNHMTPRDRKRFVQWAAQCRFSYYGVVIDKAKLPVMQFRSEESLYTLALSLVFHNARTYLRNAIVTIDGTGTRHFRRHLVGELRKWLDDDSGSSLIKKIKFHDSKGNNLLQLADMIAGAVARSYSTKTDANECREVLRKHEVRVDVWPK